MNFAEYWLLSGFLSMIYIIFDYKTITEKFSHYPIWETFQVSGHTK